VHCDPKRISSTICAVQAVQCTQISTIVSKKVVFLHSGASVAGTRTRVARVRAEYPNHLDYNGSDKKFGRKMELIYNLALFVCSDFCRFRQFPFAIRDRRFATISQFLLLVIGESNEDLLDPILHNVVIFQASGHQISTGHMTLQVLGV
jgi:hypothetical protein